LRYLARYPIGVDVCSLGELVTAQRAGFEPERITLHGAGKSDEELVAACTGWIGSIAVDGIAELQRLANISRNGHTATVMLRLNVGVDASTHAFVRTGGKDSKFGIHPRDERAAASLLLANPQLHFTGVHAHIGSQIYDESAYLENASALVAAAQRFATFGLQSQRIVIGGGFGVPSDPDNDQKRLDITATVAATTACVRDAEQIAAHLRCRRRRHRRKPAPRALRRSLPRHHRHPEARRGPGGYALRPLVRKRRTRKDATPA
jgi:diaminopimelate decarboxylase